MARWTRKWALVGLLICLGAGGVSGQVVCTDVGDFATETSTSVDSELVLFSGTTAKLGKRATGTGFAYLTNGVLDTMDHLPMYNVKDYGATGDGTTNDTAAITATFAAAGNNSIIYFPAGTYSTYTQSYTGKSGVTVRGQGHTSLLKRRDDGGPNSDPVLKFEDSFNITVEYLGIDTNGCWHYCSGIEIAETPGFRVQFNKVVDSNINTSAFPVDDKFGITIQGPVAVQDTPGYVLHNILEDVQLELDRTSNILVQGNKVIRPRFTAGIGVFTNVEGLTSGNRNVMIVDNVVQDADVSGGAITIHIDPSNQSDFVYTDFIIARNIILYHTATSGEERHGIKIGTGNTSVSTTNNIFRGFQIKDNYIWAHPTVYAPSISFSGITLASAPGPNFVFSQFTIENNVIVLPNSASIGLGVRMIDRSVVRHNMVHNMVHAESAGVAVVRAKHLRVYDNEVYGAGGSGIYFVVVSAYDEDIRSWGNLATEATLPHKYDDGPTAAYWVQDAPVAGSSTQSVAAAGNTISTWPGTMAVDLAEAGVPLTLTSTPTFVAGHEGQRFSLLNVGTQTLTLQDERSVTGTKLYLRTPAVALAQYEMLSFHYVPALTAWVQDNDGESALTNPMTTPGDMIVGTTGGTAARVPLASQPYLNVKLPPYNAVGNGVADDTAAIQAALDDAVDISGVDATNGAGIVHLPPGIYRITTISIPTPVLLQGSNMFHGSKLLQDDGVDDDAVKLKCRDDDAWFYGGIRHVHVEKKQPVTDTLGSGIGVTRTSGTCSLGESARISDLRIKWFPVAGIQVREGSAPLRITNISTFANGQFGIDLRGQHQTVLLDSISGDSNNTALINIDGTGSTYDATSIHISNVKAETNTSYASPSGPQETVVLLTTLVNARVTIENISATRGGVAPPDVEQLVKLVGSRPIVTRIIDPACSGCVNLMVDDNNAFEMVWSNDVIELAYRENGMYQAYGRNGYAIKNLALGHNVAPVAYSATGGLLTQSTNTNGVTLQTLTRATDSAPTGSFVQYKTLAAATVWDVSVAGTLVTGTIPQTRMVPQWLDQTDTASITVDCALYTHLRIDELSQTTTFNAPTTCTPNEGQALSMAIFSTTARTLSFATSPNGFSAAYGIALPTTSFTGQWVFYEFQWNGVLAKWVIVRATR